MKRLKLFLVLLVFVQVAFAQSHDEGRKVAELTFASFNSQSIESLVPYLSGDFSMNGHSGQLAKTILRQMVLQLNDSVVGFQEEAALETDEGLELLYSFVFRDLGATTATFLFSSDNLLQELNLQLFRFKTECRRNEVKTPDAGIIEIPFTMVGNLIVVEVEVEGHVKNFLFDTGSSKVVLNERHFSAGSAVSGSRKNGCNETFNCQETRVLGAQGAGGGISGVRMIEVGLLKFAGISMKNQQLLVMNLAHLEERKETDISGIIGHEMVKDYDILYDYERRVLTLIRPDNYEEFITQNMAGRNLHAVPMELHAHIPVLEVEMNNQILAMGIDCGAEANLINYELFASVQGVTDSITTRNMTGAENNPMDVKYGKIRSAQIGDKTFEQVSTLFSNISHLNRSDSINIDGLIGYPVLSRQPTLVSYTRKQVVFFD